MSSFIVLLVLVGIFVVPAIIGNYWARSMRLPEYGWRIAVVLSSALAAGVVIFVAMQPQKPVVHVVQQDDTLQSIADEYGVGVKTLTDENNLLNTDELVGRELRIPKPKRLEVKQGVDLSGGVILIYEVDEEKSQAAAGQDNAGAADQQDDSGVDIDALVEALARRINPGGVKEVVIRPYGDRQVEIIIPDVDDAEVERIKRQIVKAGFLKFLIVAKRNDHPGLFSLAQAQPNVRVVRDSSEAVGEWVPLARTEDGRGFKVEVDPNINLTRELRPGFVEVLMAYDQFNIEGKHLRSVSKGFDDTLNPAVNFSMTSRGASLFGGLTGSNLPDPQTNRSSRLGIIMDGELISAPTIQSRISDRGQITGRFSDEEVEELVNVLRAGRLPAVLKTEPITENRIDPLLGEDTIKKGKFAIGTSIAAVLVFMVIYYRFAGLVACFALLLNLVLILALMIVIRGAFTLPGLAGLVLTVGMSVDANVLIFERIREELKRGAALRMAIRNGFGRATTTIIDANITTLITALVLYGIGTDQLRGFAVTLILGILMSMFTAIFCSRVVFDLSERRRWLKKLTMTQLLDEPKLNLIGARRLAAAVSVALILLGLSAVASRGRGLFDIDFLGGTSVQARLKESMPYGDVWDRVKAIADDVSLTQVNPEGADPNTVWKIDTSLEDNGELQQKLGEAFHDGGRSLFVSHSVSYDPPRLLVKETTEEQATDDEEPAGSPVTSSISGLDDPATPDGSGAADPSDAGNGAEEDTDSAGNAPTGDADGEDGSDGDAPEPDDTDGARRKLPDDRLLAFADDVVRLAQATTTPDDNDVDSATAEDSPQDVVSATSLTFDERVTRDTLLDSIRAAADKLGVPEPPLQLTGPEGQADSAAGFRIWNLEATTTPESLDAILGEMKSGLESKPAWLSSSKIGGKVAGDTKNQALAAILVSLVCIVAYIWIRFQRVIFGLSAVVALVHDVLITLGAIAISLWLSTALGALLIDEFKISLPVVAAFLTIIGYSLNDTIVVFDRIREVRGRSPDITEEMINTSINQTLSRTLLTSATTLLVVMILYVFGGQGIHGFAFALLIGVLVGTYSSIFVASPALLWMSKVQENSDGAGARSRKQAVTKA